MNKPFFALLLAAASGLSAFSASPAFEAKVTGHGAPMILIPGLSCSGEVWESTVAQYAKDHECHVLTLAGFAGVPAVDGPFIDNEIEALSTYVREKHLDKPVLVGHSLGGFVALKFATLHPKEVGDLVIVDALPFFAGIRQPGITAQQAKESALQMAKYMNAADDATHAATLKSGAYTRMLVDKDSDHARIAAWGLASNRSTSTQAMVEMFGADLRPELASIESRILVLGGAKGLVASVPLPLIEKAYADQYSRTSKATIAVTGTANHFIMFDDPQWMFSQIDTFLKAGQLSSTP